jgi:hypothetical protein
LHLNTDLFHPDKSREGEIKEKVEKSIDII